MSWNEHIFYVAKSATWKISLLFGSRRFSRPCSFSLCLLSRNGSPKWWEASKHSLISLDAIQKRTIRLIDNWTLTTSPDSRVYQRSVSVLSQFYLYYCITACVQVIWSPLNKMLLCATTVKFHLKCKLPLKQQQRINACNLRTTTGLL